MPRPKSVKRVVRSRTPRAAAAGRVLPEYPKYFVVPVKDKAAEDHVRNQLRGVQTSMTLGAINPRAVVRWTPMANSNPPC
jgi:hypothetical protein